MCNTLLWIEAIKKGEPVIYGDITSRQILEQLGIAKCSAVIIAIDSIDSVQRAQQDIYALSPYCKIILKTKSSKFASTLQSQGVYAVVHERREVAKILSDLALQAVDENKQQADK